MTENIETKLLKLVSERLQKEEHITLCSLSKRVLPISIEYCPYNQVVIVKNSIGPVTIILNKEYGTEKKKIELSLSVAIYPIVGHQSLITKSILITDTNSAPDEIIECLSSILNEAYLKCIDEEYIHEFI